MLLIFKRTSNQTRLAAVKQQIHAAIFEIRLFNDDLRAIFRAQGEILRHNLTYLRLSLVPMLWMIVPFLLVIAQLQFHYGYCGLRVGQPVLLKVQVREGVALRRHGVAGRGARVADDARHAPATLEAPREIEVKTPAVWIPRHARGDLAHRAAGRRPVTSFRLHGRATRRITKTIQVANRWCGGRRCSLEPAIPQSAAVSGRVAAAWRCARSPRSASRTRNGTSACSDGSCTG